MLRSRLWPALLCSLPLASLDSGCAMAPPPTAVVVLQAQPEVAFRTLGMVSGQGPNVEAAIEHARYQAGEMGGDAIIVGRQHNVGAQWVVSVKVIKYLAPPPQQQQY